MILHTLRVKNWRALREPVELAELSTGLNVIHGPNEAGKSTVMDAICRGFYDRHNTGGEGMKSRQPWGSSLGPTVDFEFSVGDQRYHLRKRFLEDKLCELSRWRDGGWERVAEGKRADEQILDLASGDTTGRGMTKPEHWGLGQVLWACQGDATQLSVGESQQARLREALKITLDGTQGEAIEQAIGERYTAVYTSTGQLRKGERNKAEVVRLQEEVEQAEQQVDQLQQRMAAVEQDAHELAAAEDEHEQTQEELEQAQNDLKTRREELNNLAEQQRAYEKHQAEAQEAERAWQTINDRVQAIKEADEAVKKAADQVNTLSKAGDQAQVRRKKAEETLRKAKEKRREAAEEHKRNEKALAAANRLVRWLTCEQELGKLREQRDQAQTVQTQIAERQQELDQLAAPTPQQLKQLRKLQQQIERKQAELEAASLSVRLEPEQPLSMQVETDGEPAQPHQASKPLELTALSTMAVDIEGVGRIVVRSGQSDAAELAEELEALRQKWREATADLASQDLSQLEELQTRRQLLEQHLKTLKKQAESDDLTELQAQIGELEHRRQALLVEDPNLEKTDQIQGEAKRAHEQAQKRRDHAQEVLERAESELEQAQQEQDAARDEATKQESQLSGARATLNVRQEETDRRRQEDGLSDEQRREALLTARRQADAAQQRLEGTTKPPTEDLSYASRIIRRRGTALVRVAPGAAMVDDGASPGMEPPSCTSRYATRQI